MSADEAVDRVLKSADDAARAGDDAKAAALLEEDGARVAEEAVAEVEREPLETPWGRSRRDALLELVRARRASIPSYAQALRGEDLDAKLTALQVQIELQKKAMGVVSAALSAPGPLADAG